MKPALKRILSIFLTLMMIGTFVPTMSFAAAQPTFTMNVYGKDGTTTSWSETWYFQNGTAANKWLDATLTKNEDGTGGELSILNTFDDDYFKAHPEYSYFDSYDAFLYVGGRRGPTARVGVVKKGILMDDIVSYAEKQSGIANLKGKTCVQMKAGSDGKIWPYDNVENCSYDSYYWGEERYYFKGMAEKKETGGHYGIWFSDEAMALMTDENRIKVPYVFAMVGFGGENKSLQEALDAADTEMSLRTYMGTTTKNKEEYEKEQAAGGADFTGNLGNPSAQNINVINFYPAYNAITVKDGTSSGTEGQDGYKMTASHAVVTADDNYFKAAAGEQVTLKVASEDSSLWPYVTLSITDAENDSSIEVQRSGDKYTFTMPEHGVNVSAAALGKTSESGDYKAITTSVQPSGAGLLTASSGTVDADGNAAAAAGSIVNLTVDTYGAYTVDKVEYSSDGGKNWNAAQTTTGGYSFTMPDSDVSVRAVLKGSLEIYVTEPGASTQKKTDITYEKINSLDESEDFYYGGFSSAPAAFEGKATVSVELKTLLENAGVEFSKGDEITFKTSSDESITFTYDKLYSQSRYYFPALYTGKNWSARSNGKITITPHIVMNGICQDCSDGSDITKSETSAENTPALAFGMSMDEFSKNSDASPSTGSLTELVEKLVYIKSINVKHALNYDISWYVGHESDQDYTISTEAQLRGLAAIVDGTALSGSAGDSDAAGGSTASGDLAGGSNSETYMSVAQDSFSGKTIKLGADIRLSSKWNPIGDSEHAFAGTFDGCGHSILDMNITDCTGGYQGLFANNTGEIKDFTISGSIGSEKSPITSGSDNIGGAVGYNNGTVSGIISDVAINVSAGIYAIGGIAGQNGDKGIIKNCQNNANISAKKAAGGIAGRSYGSVYACVNKGDITGNGGGKDGIGGIVGIAGNKSSTYQNSVISCYNEGTISNNNGRWHGGIVGMADSASTVKNCFNTGSIVSGYSWNWNPIIGHVDGAYQTVTNNYSLAGLAAGDTTDATKPLTIGIIKTAEEMRSADFVTLLGDDYKVNDGCMPVLNWQTVQGHTWDKGVVKEEPTFTSEGSRVFTCERCLLERTESIPAVDDSKLDGLDIKSTVWDGKAVDISWYIGHENDSVYTIDTAAKLAGAAAIVNGIVNDNCMVYDNKDVVSADIWNDSKYVNNATGTHGECNRATDDYSYGIENFNGKTLKLTADLDMSAGNYMPIGGQYRMNVENKNSKIGSSFCGIFDGNGHYVTIVCDRYAGADYGDGQSIGLIGRIGVHDNDPEDLRPANAAVLNVGVKGSIKGNRSVGGIVGKIGKTVGGATIDGCVNYAAIYSTDAKGTGGICGSAWNGGLIQNCYNMGDVTNTHNSYGGIAGSNEIHLRNCYNVGYISGAGKSAAIATDQGGTYQNCYWLNTSANMGAYDISNDQIIEKNSDEMHTAAFAAALGDAFSSDSKGINAKYPVLKWQLGDQDSSSGGTSGGGSGSGGTSGGGSSSGGSSGGTSTGGNTSTDDTSKDDGKLPDDSTSTDDGASTITYKDVNADDWFSDAVNYVSKKNLMNGVGDDMFAPQSNMTRAMVVTILYRMEGSPSVDGTASFSDVASGSWYADAVKWAADSNIVNGISSDTFAPKKNVTREQLVCMMYRYAEYKNIDTTLEGELLIDNYTDKDDISAYAADSVKWSLEKAIIQGSGSKINPKGNATRAQMAQILCNFLTKDSSK